MKNNIKLSDPAVDAIISLQHKNGTYRFYSDTISRLYNLILLQSDEIGMSDREAMATLRALYCLKEDLGYISGIASTSEQLDIDIDDDPEDVAERVEATFSNAEELDEAQKSASPQNEKLDEQAEMVADIHRAYIKLNEVENIISEAMIHATNSGSTNDIIDRINSVKTWNDHAISVMSVLLSGPDKDD